jgi:hypothetical protein
MTATKRSMQHPLSKLSVKGAVSGRLLLNIVDERSQHHHRTAAHGSQGLSLHILSLNPTVLLPVHTM